MKWMFILCSVLTTLSFGQTKDPHSEFGAQKKFVSLSTGINMAFVDTGNKNGIPVILLHGFTDTGRSFQPMLDPLKDENGNLRVIVPDLRGHGASSMPDGSLCARLPEKCFSPEALSQDIISLMDHLRLTKVHLVGHSMGSVVAQELAFNHSDRVLSMTLIGTFVNGKESATVNSFLLESLIEGSWKALLENNEAFRWPQDAYALTPKDLGKEALLFLKENWVAEPSAADQLINAIYPETIDTPLGTWIGVVRSLSQLDNRAKFQSLKVPTLVLWPTQDSAFPERDQNEVKKALELAAKNNDITTIFKIYGKAPLSAEGYTTNDLGHNLQWAAPEEVAKDVASYITKGFPVRNLPHADPTNNKNILVDEASHRIEVWNNADEID